MNIFHNIIRTIARRPSMVLEYCCKSLRFSFNYILWKAIPRKWLTIGPNPHIATTTCFRAERPFARIEIGSDFTAYKRCKISAWGRGWISIGDYCSIGSRTTIDCRERIEIGDYVLISWDVSICDYESHPLDPEERAKEMEYSKAMLWPQFKKNRKDPDYEPVFDCRPVVIEDKVWIGARATILKGARIGYGSIVAAGAVVTKDVPPHSIVAGNPATVVKRIEPRDDKRP